MSDKGRTAADGCRQRQRETRRKKTTPLHIQTAFFRAKVRLFSGCFVLSAPLRGKHRGKQRRREKRCDVACVRAAKGRNERMAKDDGRKTTAGATTRLSRTASQCMCVRVCCVYVCVCMCVRACVCVRARTSCVMVALYDGIVVFSLFCLSLSLTLSLSLLVRDVALLDSTLAPSRFSLPRRMLVLGAHCGLLQRWLVARTCLPLCPIALSPSPVMSRLFFAVAVCAALAAAPAHAGFCSGMRLAKRRPMRIVWRQRE